MGGNESRRIRGVGGRKGNSSGSSTPHTESLNDKSAAVDTSFDAQTGLQRDKITFFQCKEPSNIKTWGENISEYTINGTTDRGPLSTAHLEFDDSKIISSGEQNQEQTRSMPSSRDSASNAQPQRFSAASPNSNCDKQPSTAGSRTDGSSTMLVH